MLEEVRAATRENHAALDAQLELLPETITRARYAEVLAGMLRVVAPLERMLEVVPRFWGEALPDGSSRRKTALLVADLADLAALGAPVLRPSPPPALPIIETVAQAFGCTYVLEGSTLGGVILARTLGPKLAAPNAMSFWTAYGAATGARFRTFCDALERWAADRPPAERAAVIETAGATFDAFAAVFAGG